MCELQLLRLYAGVSLFLQPRLDVSFAHIAGTSRYVIGELFLRSHVRLQKSQLWFTHNAPLAMDYNASPYSEN